MLFSSFIKKLCIVSIYLLPLASLRVTVQAQKNYWQQQVSFIIEVSLDDSEHSLAGFEKIEYVNNSPDTLHFIWFHLWPNAYKNDKTAFSEQLLTNDRTDFYFSGQEQKGFINRLDFKVNGKTARLEDHPQHIDIVKLILPEPLEPKQSVNITTPFHVQLPQNFSRGGHEKQSYQVTQWYPKPAVYDSRGWHPMPYLDQGEFYSEFGNYDVRINIPENYVVAATGDLQNEDELVWLKNRAGNSLPATNKIASPPGNKKPVKKPSINSLNEFSHTSTQIKSLRYLQDKVHDFAWFADKRFVVGYDTIQLSSGRTVDAFSYSLPNDKTWQHSLKYIKDAVRTRSSWLGEYPYKTISVVEAKMGFDGGMEYPTITSISPTASAAALEETIAHEVSHNWLYGILATDERNFPWMDEGMNTYYDARDNEAKNEMGVNNAKGLASKLSPPISLELISDVMASIKKDQPINTPSQNFTELNYTITAYYKASEWMKHLESLLGRNLFDSCMREYYRLWQFKHPYPEDFKNVMETTSGKNLDDLFLKLDQKGSLASPIRRTVHLATFFNLNDTRSKKYISVAPAPGFNLYDGLMIGGIIHNYQLPLNKFSFLLMPMYATHSKKFQGMGRASYTWYPDKTFYKIDVGMSATKFSMNEYKPQDHDKLFPGFKKFVPFLRVTLREPDPLKKISRYLQFKSFFMVEDQLSFRQVINGTDTTDQVNTKSENSTIKQLKFVVHNQRVLYPYRGELQLEQNKKFLRATFTGNYYFNYANGKGGINTRVFAGKFLYSSAKTSSKQFETDRYHLNLTGANGYEDYTFSDFFVGRNKFEGWGSQQIMIRDGGFKVRTDMLNNKIGKTDDWLAATNFTADVPDKINPLSILPFKLPLKFFVDIGTSADAWVKNAETTKFLFDAGLQLSLFKETVNIYVPVIYSKVFKDYFRSTLGDQRFWKTVSFSMDIQNFNLRKINRYIPL